MKLQLSELGSNEFNVPWVGFGEVQSNTPHLPLACHAQEGLR